MYIKSIKICDNHIYMKERGEVEAYVTMLKLGRGGKRNGIIKPEFILCIRLFVPHFTLMLGKK